MAAQRTKRKQRPAAESAPEPPDGMLKLRKDPRSERRFEPTSSGGALVTMVGMSVGAVAFGAGVYGQWLRTLGNPELTTPHPYALYLLVGGSLLILAMGLLGPRAARPIRVGDAGLAVEKDDAELDRLEWRDVERVVADASALTFEGSGSRIAISLQRHAAAAARALAEAKRRIPSKLEELEDWKLPKPDDEAGEVIPLDKPQLAGARCKASDELIAFEKDARLCGMCGEVYHKDHVPPRCLTCDVRLTGG